MTFLIIKIIHKDIEKINTIAKSLFEKKIIATCDLFPIGRLSFDDGHIKNNPEIVLNIKTKLDNWYRIVNEIENLYPNEVVPIIRYEVSSNEKYERWIEDNSN